MSGGGAQNPKKKQEKFKIDKKTPPRRGQLEAQKERKKPERWRARISEKNRDLYLPSSLCICINRDNCEGVAGGVGPGEARVFSFFLYQSPDAIKWVV